MLVTVTVSFESPLPVCLSFKQYASACILPPRNPWQNYRLCYYCWWRGEFLLSYRWPVLQLGLSRFSHLPLAPYKFRVLTSPPFRRFQFNDNDTIPKFFEAINAGDAHALSLAPLIQELNFISWDRTGSRSKMSLTMSSLSEISQNWGWKNVLSPPPSWNNLANLYNSGRCIHVAASA